jgi:hypothetical protein
MDSLHDNLYNILAFVPLETRDLKVIFDYEPFNMDTNSFSTGVIFQNLSSETMTDFVFQAAVPKVYLSIRSCFFKKKSHNGKRPLLN